MRFAILAAVAALGMSVPVSAAVSVDYDSDDFAYFQRLIPGCPVATCVTTDTFSFIGKQAFGHLHFFENGPTPFTPQVGKLTFTSFKINDVELIGRPYYSTEGVPGFFQLRIIGGVALNDINTASFTIESTSRSLTVANSFILFSDSAVPEPETWAMMIGGFGMVGGSMRHRRRARMRATI